MMKRAILLVVCLMGMTCAFAQTAMQDVLYLKNGSIIRGDIVEMVPGETVKIMTADGSVFVHEMADVEKFAREQVVKQNRWLVEKKSPWFSGILSLCIPGLGQMYNGESRKGWVDFGTHMGGYLAATTGLALALEYSGYEDYYYDDFGNIVYDYHEGNEFLSTVGGVLLVAGVVTVYANIIHSVFDAVKSSNRLNAENGYVMYRIGDRCALGIQPSMAYERPQYMQGTAPELSAGMNVKLTF